MVSRDEKSRTTGAPLRLGVTGSIGAGKSAVTQLLAARGAAVIDADRLARQATEDPAVLRRIAAGLGSDLVQDGVLDRSATAERVFGDAAALAKLNAIIHPWVARERSRLLRKLAAQAEAPAVIVEDIPLLFENGLEREMDATLLVTAPLELRAARVARRSGLSAGKVRERDAAQWPQERKAALATWVIDNSGGLPALERAVDTVWQELSARQAGRQDQAARKKTESRR
jgi:dephospho-CoA kinase